MHNDYNPWECKGHFVGCGFARPYANKNTENILAFIRQELCVWTILIENETYVHRSGSKMATSGAVLNEFVSQNAVIIVITGVLATIIALIAYYVARIYLPSNTTDSVKVNSETLQNESSLRLAAPHTDTTVTEEGPESDDSKQQPAIDPVQYCEHIQGEIKKVKQSVTARKICESLSEEQIAEERQRQHDQLSEIFRLMQQQEDKFGIKSMDEMQEQMRLYADLK